MDEKRGKVNGAQLLLLRRIATCLILGRASTHAYAKRALKIIGHPSLWDHRKSPATPLYPANHVGSADELVAPIKEKKCPMRSELPRIGVLVRRDIKMRHKWTDPEHMVVLYLAKAYSDTRWKADRLATKLLRTTGVTASSLQMAIGNFRSLLNLGGLKNTSKAQRTIFVKYGPLNTGLIRQIAQESLAHQVVLASKNAGSRHVAVKLKLSPAITRRKYALPSFLHSRLSQESYVRWLHRKAVAHAKRDRKRGNDTVKNAQYKIAIHHAVCACNGRDAYTHESLAWELVSKYDNAASKAGRREYKAQFSRLPTVDHVGDGKGAADFRICAWRTNDAKSDMTLKEFVRLCRKVVQAQGSMKRFH